MRISKRVILLLLRHVPRFLLRLICHFLLGCAPEFLESVEKDVSFLVQHKALEVSISPRTKLPVR